MAPATEKEERVLGYNSEKLARWKAVKTLGVSEEELGRCKALKILGLTEKEIYDARQENPTILKRIEMYSRFMECCFFTPKEDIQSYNQFSRRSSDTLSRRSESYSII